MPEPEAPAFAPESPSPAPPQSPAPEAAPTGSTAAPAAPPITIEAAPEPSPDAAPPEGEPEGAPEEPAAPVWASFENAESALEHPDVVPLLERRAEDAYNRAYSDVQSQMQPSVQKQEEYAANVDKRMTDFMSVLKKQVRAGSFDQSALEEVIEDHPEVFSGINGQAQQTGRHQGVDSAVAELLTKAGAADKLLSFQARLGKLRQGLSEPTFAEDLVKAISDAAITKAKERWEKDEGKLVRERVEAQVRNEKRQEQPAPAEPKGGSAGTGGAYKNLDEARALHADGKISNTEMRQAKIRFAVAE